MIILHKKLTNIASLLEKHVKLRKAQQGFNLLFIYNFMIHAENIINCLQFKALKLTFLFEEVDMHLQA